MKVDIIIESKAVFISYILMIILVLESVFENTPLAIYDLKINRIIFIFEVILFFIMLLSNEYIRERLAYDIIGLVFIIISYFVLDSSIIFKMYMMAVLVSNIGYNKSFEIIFKIKFVAVITIILLSLCGFLSKYYTVIEKGIGIKYGYGLGFTHPNRLACAILYLILCFVCWKKDEITKTHLIGISIITIITFCLTQSRTLIISVLLLVILLLIYKQEKNSKMISALGIISVPACLFLSIGIPLLLLSSKGVVREIIYFINQKFSRRFTNIEHAFLIYPITMTGGIYDFSIMKNMFGYSVIDNGYIRFLYNYGVIGLALFCLLTIISIIMLVKRKKYVYAIVCIIGALEGLTENIYIMFGLNILFIFWSELFNSDE